MKGCLLLCSNGHERWKKKKKGLHGSLKQLRCNETQPR
jgi:hypothetical protein